MQAKALRTPNFSIFSHEALFHQFKSGVIRQIVICGTDMAATEAVPDRPSLPWRMASATVMTLTGAISRVFLYALNDIQTEGQDEFLGLLDKRRASHADRGLITGIYAFLSTTLVRNPPLGEERDSLIMGSRTQSLIISACGFDLCGFRSECVKLMHLETAVWMTP